MDERIKYVMTNEQNFENTADAIRTRNFTQTTMKPSEFAENILDIRVSVSKKTINFYDYDGIRLYSYTAQEALALTELPPNPVQPGLIAQGWNWTLEQIKDTINTWVSEKGNILNIGQCYGTDDNTTRIYIKLSDEIKSPYISLCVDGTVTIDWGDGTSSELTGTSLTSIVQVQHVYETGGLYVIKLSSSVVYNIKGYFYERLFTDGVVNQTSLTNLGKYYAGCVYKIELSNNVIDYYNNSHGRTLAGFYNLKSITIPKDHNSNLKLGEAFFAYCTSLECVILPETITYGYAYMFRGCTNLKVACIPKILTLPTGTFEGCTNLRELAIRGPGSKDGSNTFLSYCTYLNTLSLLNTINIFSDSFNGNVDMSYLFLPATVTTIKASGFKNCYNLKVLDMSKHSSIITLDNIDAFTNVPADCKFIVPDILYEDWIVANNWSSFEAQIMKASDYYA